jgi:hypothetical protein
LDGAVGGGWILEGVEAIKDCLPHVSEYVINELHSSGEIRGIYATAGRPRPKYCRRPSHCEFLAHANNFDG